MKQIFAPGCALMLYKPHLAERIQGILKANLGDMDLLSVCCHHQPPLSQKTEVINICPGCDKRYRNDYPMTSTVSLWEVLANGTFFSFPDYQGQTMSIIDACPTRDQDRVHTAIRTLLERMNIRLVEPRNTRTKSTCCGDSFWGQLPVDQVKKQMVKRTAEMPVDDVAVYCVSCTKSVFIGGKKPHYMIDLLFGEETVPQVLEPEQWHKLVDDYIEKH
jgi:Fe-S oxidoreductase